MNQTVGQSLAQQRVPAGAREGQGEDQSKELNINRDAGAFRPQVSISSYVSSPEAVELRCEGSQSFRMNGRARQDGSDGRTKCATDSRPLPLDVSREDSTSGNGDLRFHRTLSPLDQSTIPDGRSSHSILSSPSKSPSDMPPDDGPGSRSSYDILRSSSRSTGSSPAASSTRGKRTANRRPSRLMVSAFLSTAGAAEAGSISGNAESNTQQRELPVDENFIAQASHAEEEPVIAHMGKMRRLGEGNLSKRSLAPSLSIRRSSISNQNWLDGRSSALPLPGLSIATASFQRINAPFSRLDSLKDAGTPKRAESKRFLTLKSSKFKLEDGEASTSASPAAQRGTSQPSEQESRAASLVANVLSERSLSRQKSCTKSLKGQMQSRRLIQMMEGDSSSDEQEITENDTLSSEEKKAKMFAWMKHGTKTTRTLLASEARAKKEEDRQRKKEEEEAARQRRIQEEEEMRRKEEEEAAELLKQFEAGGAYKARKLSEAEAKWKERNLRILLTMLEAGDGGEDGYRALATDFIVRTKRAATTIQRRWRQRKKEQYWKKLEGVITSANEGQGLLVRNEWGGFQMAGEDPFAKPEEGRGGGQEEHGAAAEKQERGSNGVERRSIRPGGSEKGREHFLVPQARPSRVRLGTAQSGLEAKERDSSGEESVKEETPKGSESARPSSASSTAGTAAAVAGTAAAVAGTAAAVAGSRPETARDELREAIADQAPRVEMPKETASGVKEAAALLAVAEDLKKSSVPRAAMVAPFSAVEPSTGEKASRQGARRPGTKGKQQRQGAETNRHRKAQARISAHACSVTSPADTSGQAGVHQARDGATGLRAGESRMADGAPQMAGREEGCTGLPGHARLTPGTPSRRKPNQDVKSAHRHDMSNIATEGHAQRASRMASFALKAAKAGLERVTMRLTQVKAFSVADIAKWTSASKWRVVLLKYTLMDILRVADGHDDDLKTKIMQWMGMRSVKMLDDLLKDAREVAGKQEVDPASADGGSPALRFRLMKFQTWLEMIEELLAKLPVLAAGQGTPRAQATNKMQARFLSHFREQQEAHMERGIFPEELRRRKLYTAHDMPLRLPANLRRPEHEDPESLAAIFVKGSSKSEGRGEGEGGNALPLLSNLPKKPHLFSRKGPKKGRTFAVLPPRPLLDSSQSRRGSRDSHPTASSPWDRRRTDTVKEGGKQTPSYVGVIKGDEAIAGWQTPEQERSSSKAMTTLATKHGPTRTDAIKKWADRLYLPAVLTRQWDAKLPSL